LIRPAYKSGLYDIIIQDRGILSGIIYANACGVDANQFTPCKLGQDGVADNARLYDATIVLNRKKHSLEIATSVKDEFGNGDAMESRGDEFHAFVNQQFQDCTSPLNQLYTIASTRTMFDVNVDEYDGRPLALSTYIFNIINQQAAVKNAKSVL
jgi:hypothetical protein